MTTYTRPLGGGTPTTGQVVEAVHVNDPIDQIYDTILAGGITADQIAAGAVDTAELATAAVTAVKMDGTLPDASEMATSIAPTTDKQLANKKYTDDRSTMVPAISGAGVGYVGEESVTFPNGLIMKMGAISTGGGTGQTLTFGTAFPTALVSITMTGVDTGGNDYDVIIITQLMGVGVRTSITYNTESTPGWTQITWIAIGY